MRNLSNLGLVEMTEQEMREVNGGWSFWDVLDLYVEYKYGYRIQRGNVCCCDGSDWFECDYCPCCSVY